MEIRRFDGPSDVLHDFACCRDDFGYAIRTWSNDTRQRHCYILYINDVITSIVLLRLCDQDALAEYEKPYWIDYVFTIPNARRQNHATQLLQHIQLYDTTVGFGTEIMEKVFKKAQYHRTKNMNINVYRYP